MSPTTSYVQICIMMDIYHLPHPGCPHWPTPSFWPTSIQRTIDLLGLTEETAKKSRSEGDPIASRGRLLMLANRAQDAPRSRCTRSMPPKIIRRCTRCPQQTPPDKASHCYPFPQPSPRTTKPATLSKKCGLADTRRES